MRGETASRRNEDTALTARACAVGVVRDDRGVEIGAEEILDQRERRFDGDGTRSFTVGWTEVRLLDAALALRLDRLPERLGDLPLLVGGDARVRRRSLGL